MQHNPKFDKHIKSMILSHENSKSKGRYGLIMGYDKTTNTATVLLSAPDSDVIGDLLRQVPCPVQLGVQSVSPEPGRPCWVVFKNDRDNHNAVVSHYFNQHYNEFDYSRQTQAMSGVPNFMLGM